MQYTIQAEETAEAETPLFSVPKFQQRLLRFDGDADERKDDRRDEVLYVLEGTALASVGDDEQELLPGTGVFVARGTPWRIESAQGLKLLSVLVEEPLAASASHALIANGERGSATAGREFTLLAHPENGCASVTQFVGYIPPGRLDVACTIVMDEVEGQGHQIVGSRVEVVVRVEGVEDAALQAAVARAHASCPFSQLLERAGATVTVTARLA